MTFSVPPQLKKRAQARRDMNWSGVVQRAIEDRLDFLERADRVLAKSRLTMKDVERIGRKVKRRMAEHYGLVPKPSTSRRRSRSSSTRTS